MITECYIKGRFDFGVGKCAVVIVENDEVVYKRGWVIKESFLWDEQVIEPDQFNCEIVAATHAMRWCSDNQRKAVNLYANTSTCQKWYYRRDFPEGRFMGDAFNKFAEGIDVYADYIPKKDTNIYNLLVNELATNAR